MTRDTFKAKGTPPSAPVGVEWIMELADEYDAKGHHDRAYDLRSHAKQSAAVDGAMKNLRDAILRNDGLTRKNTLAAFRAVEDALAAQPQGDSHDQ